MSIIQDIRDKYAKVAIVLIALSLVGFILTDYIRGKERQRGSQGANTVGSVNGKSINYRDFDGLVQQTQLYYERNQNMQISPDMKQNIVEQVWSQTVDRVLIEDEAARIGLSVGKKERGDIYFGPNAPQDLKSFGAAENGQYDAGRAKKQMEQYLKSDKISNEQKNQLRTYLTQLEQGRLSEKFYSLFYKSANVPRWMVEKQIADNSLIAKASVVRALYTDSVFARDTTIKLTDKEIEDYISKHKDDFKQPESRSIDFVTFNAAPSAADTAAAKVAIEKLKTALDTTNTDLQAFLQRNNSDYPENFVPASQLSPSGKDSIIRLPKNGVYGPYKEADAFLMAKLLDTKTFPDSARAKHILIQTYDPQSQKQLMDEAAAKKRIDSIFDAIKKGANFDTLAKRFSDDNKTADGGSAAKGGDLGWFAYGTMVPEFNSFCFEKPVGSMDLVKTSFGWHLIQVTGQKNPQPNYKVAYIRQQISTSDETENAAQQAANDFAARVKDIKSFDEEYQKNLKPKGMIKGIGKGISRNAGSASPQIGFSRELVREIYKSKVGEVIKSIKVGDNYVVCVVTEAFEEGTQSVAAARPGIEPVLLNRKKANLLKQKLGKIASLEAAAATLGTNVLAVDSLRMTVGAPKMNLPYDGKVYGAIFNPSNKGKLLPEAIVGEFGVYVVQPESVTATAPDNSNVADMRKQLAGSVPSNQLGALKLAAKIKDKRSEIY